MTVTDLRCDRCGSALTGLATGPDAGANEAVRFRYHPGRKDLADDAGLMCVRCWSALVDSFADPGTDACAWCGVDLGEQPALFVNEAGEPTGWRLCRDDALVFLNGLRTVVPKLHPSSFVLPPRDSG